MLKAFGAIAAAGLMVVGAAAFAPSALAQDCGCGCPNAKGPQGADRIGTSKKKVRRTTGGGSTPAGAITPGGASVATTADWQDATGSTWATAQAENRPIVLYFTEYGASEPVFAEEVVEASRKTAIFVKVYTVDVDLESEEGTASIVPQDKLSADNYWKAYDVDATGTMVICDWFGNEYERHSKIPSARTLTGDLSDVVEDVEDTIEDLKKDLERAQKYIDDDANDRAITQIVDIFEEGFYGYDVVNDTVALYEELLEDGRSRLEAAKKAADKDAIAAIAKEFRGTELEGEAVSAEETISASK